MTGSIILPANDNMGIIPSTNNYGQIGSSDKKFYRMYATNFYGTLQGNATSATSATTATKATQDASGNVITSTYATKSELNTAKSNLQTSIDGKLSLSGGTMTGSIIMPKNDNMGIIPDTNNYGQIGSSDKWFYRTYSTKYYGSETKLNSYLEVNKRYNLGAHYNYTSGYLIEIGTADSDTMCMIHITGNSYSASDKIPIDSLYQFYDYNSNGIINYSARNLGHQLGTMTVYKYDGKLYAHIKQTKNYQTLSFELITNRSGLIPKITNAAAHTSGYTHLITITPDNVSVDGHTHTVVNGVTPEWSGTIANADAAYLAAWTSDGKKIKALSKSSAKVGYASSADTATTATTATNIKDYNGDYKIQIGFNGSGISGDQIAYIAGYTNSNGIKIKDVSKSALQSWLGLGSAAYTASTAYATSGHAHNYAGSSSAGGSATSAVKLDTTTAGSATQPAYFSGGKPVACTYTLGKSVPSNAVFTDTTYSAATQSAQGLMSAADKKKLDGIATGANAYSLPTASSSTLGGVKTTSTVTSISGLTACPIISGVPYYKDTNTTYSLSSFGITATAAELNYTDGVTSNIQTQLNGKAASSHIHSYLPLSGGTVTGATTFKSTVKIGNATLTYDSTNKRLVISVT